MGALAALRYQPQIERSMARATAPLDDYFRRRADMAQQQIAQNRQLEMQREQLSDRRQYEAAQNLDEVKAQIFQQTGQWPEGDSLEEVFQSVQPEFDRGRQQERLAERAQVLQSEMDNQMGSIESILQSANQEQLSQAVSAFAQSEEARNALSDDQLQVLQENPTYENFKKITGTVGEDYAWFNPFRNRGGARQREQELAQALQAYMPEQLGQQFSLALSQIAERLGIMNEEYGNTLAQLTEPEALRQALGQMEKPQLGGRSGTQARADPGPRRGQGQPDPTDDPIGAIVGGRSTETEQRETPPPPRQRDREPDPTRAGMFEVQRRRTGSDPSIRETLGLMAERAAGQPVRRAQERRQSIRSGFGNIDPAAPQPQQRRRIQSGEQFPEPQFSRRLVDPVTGEEFEIPEPRLPAGVNFDFEQAARRSDLSAVPQFGRR